jgi:hypothetical protein
MSARISLSDLARLPSPSVEQLGTLDAKKLKQGDGTPEEGATGGKDGEERLRFRQVKFAPDYQSIAVPIEAIAAVDPE